MTQPATALPPPPSLDALHRLVQPELLQVNDVILSCAMQEVPLINAIAGHIIAGGGKRLRPALTLACARLCGYVGDQHVRLAAAVELIHTATLLHDDVVDESTLRRGDKTANAIWSNQASVLVGDFLLSRAFQMMVGSGSLDVLRILSDASATISQGEVMQLATVNEPATEEKDYLAVITAKTATLFAAACELGPLLSGRKDAQAELAAFGLKLGIAFQLVDDALDYSADQVALGKRIGDDFREGKITLPVILAYRQGREAERRFWERALRDLEQDEADFSEAMRLIAKHNTLRATLERADGYCREAAAHLDMFPPSEIKAALEETLSFCTSRGY